MRDDARPYRKVIFQLIGIANYLQKGPDRIALRGWGLDWVGLCAFELGCGIGGNVMNDGKYKSGKKMHQLFPRPLSAKTMRFPRQEVTIAQQTQFQASLSE